MENAGKEVMKRDPIYELLTTYKSAIKNVLPKHLTPERILRVAYTAIHRTPKLRECTHESLINAVMEISMLGLDIGRTAHIVPFGREATFICDYKGFIDLAHRSDRIEAFTFKPVYEQDDFEYMEGTSRYIKHKPFRGVDRGDLVAAYSIVFFKHGGYDFDVVEAPDIAATKKMSPGAKKSDSPWNKKDLEWTMWCKTAARRLAKRVPQSPELQRAAYLEELAEAGLKQDIHHVSKTIDIEPIPEASGLTKAIKEKAEVEQAVFNRRGGIIPDKKPEPASVEREATEPELEKVEETITPDFRSEWIKLKAAGFATYFHKNRESFELAPIEIQEEARAKWLKLYPKTPWPLAFGSEDEELKAVNTEINDYFPMQTVDAAQKNLELPPNRALSLDESNLLLAECQRLTKGGWEDLA